MISSAPRRDSVNVTTSNSFTPHGFFASQTRSAQRSAKTAVFPEPAAALTSEIPVPRFAIASFCRMAVHFADSPPWTFWEEILSAASNLNRDNNLATVSNLQIA